MAGVDDGEEPPVPIPNTEVKLTCAEDSWQMCIRDRACSGFSANVRIPGLRTACKRHHITSRQFHQAVKNLVGKWRIN